MKYPCMTCTRVCRRAGRATSRRAFTLVELVIVIGLILLLVAITVTVSVGVMRQSEVRESQNVITILDNALQEWLLQDQGQLTYGRGANHPNVDGFGEPCINQPPSRTYRLPQLSLAGTTWSSPANALEVAQKETDFLIATLMRRPAFEDMIGSIDSRYIQQIEVSDPPENVDMEHFGQGYLDFTPGSVFRFLDAWEQPILMIHPGRAYERNCVDDESYAIDEANNRYADDDGTIRTPLENAFGVAESRRIFFVSGGPSERFGLLHLNEAEGNLTDTQRQHVERAGDNIYSYPVEIDRARPQ